jgi:hypothetical protein
METLKSVSGSMFRRLNLKPNFMTPNFVGYYKIKDGEAEVTKGDFLGNTLYGVTVAQNNRKKDDLSKCCHSMDEVTEYINSLN